MCCGMITNAAYAVHLMGMEYLKVSLFMKFSLLSSVKLYENAVRYNHN